MAKTQALQITADQGLAECIGIQALVGQVVGTLQPNYIKVFIDPDPNQGEVFKVGSAPDKTGKYVDRFALAKNSLEVIAQGLGICWDVNKTGVKELTRDYVHYEAVGAYRNPDGTHTPLIGAKELDMEAVQAEVEMNQLRKSAQEIILAKWGKKYNKLEGHEKATLRQRAECYLLEDFEEREQRVILQKVKAEMVQMRQHKLARAETGAKNRAIRSIGLKSTYSEADLAQPFALVRWQLNVSREDVEQRSIDLWGSDGPQPLRIVEATEAAPAALPGAGGQDLAPEPEAPQGADAPPQEQNLNWWLSYVMSLLRDVRLDAHEFRTYVNAAHDSQTPEALAALAEEVQQHLATLPAADPEDGLPF